MTTDQDAAIDFYTTVVGWTAADHAAIRPWAISATPSCRRGDRGMGGVMQLTDEMCAGGARPGWVGYIGVADTDAKAEGDRGGRRHGS